MMWIKFTIYLIIIVFIKLCGCDDFFIVNKYEGARFYCITNSSFALSWIINDTSVGTDLQQVSHFLPKPQHLWNIGDEMNRWGYKKKCSEEIILDRRWERIKIHKTDYVEHINETLKFTTVNPSLTKNFDIPFSIRIKNEAHIFLCDGDNVTNSNCYWFLFFGFSGTKSAIRKCPRATVPSNNGESVKTPCSDFKTIVEHNNPSQFLNQSKWNHFRLSKVGNTLALKLPNDSSIVSYTEPGDVFNVKYMIIHSKNNVGLWKFHEIDYYFTAEEKKMKFQNPIQVIDGSICISMFAKMCESCTIKLEIGNREFSTIIESQQFTREGSGWQEIKFEKINISSNQIYLSLITKYDEHGPKPFWNISDITQCGKNNFRIIELGEMADCQLVSNKTETLSLNDSNQIEEARFVESYKCRENEIGSVCIPCLWFINKGCSRMKICEKFNQKTQCFCSAGYFNETVCSVCKDGYYGYFCRNKCAEHCRNCNNVYGTCSSCTENYRGSKCDIPPISFKNTPSIANLGYTNVTITLNFDLSENTNVDPYIYLYKKGQGQFPEWQNSTEVGKRKIIKIDNLEPGQNYLIKHVVVDVDKAHDIATLDFTTKCDAGTEKYFFVKPSNTSCTIFMSQKVRQRVCPFRILKVKSTNPSDTNDFPSDYSSSNITLSHLKPFQAYTVLIKTDYKEICKLFNTTEGIPEKVSNLMAINNNTNINLTWKKPEKINGELRHYTVKYKIKKYNGCGKAVSECCEKTANVKQENIILSDLNPYTTMLFSVSAANAKFEGIPENTELTIPASDFIDNEEIPKVQRPLKVNARSVHVQFSSINCKKFQGPLIIMLNAKCSEEGCKNINVTKDYNDLNIKLSHLSVFTNYSLELKYCRTKTCCSTTSERFDFQTETESPFPVRNLTVYTKNDNFISLRWLPPFPPTGILEGYNVRYFTNTRDLVSKNITITPCRLWREFHCSTLTNLTKSKSYSIDIMAKNKTPKQFGQQKSIATITRTEQPEEPPGLKHSWTLENDLKISWQHPIQANGYIERFDITVIATNPNDTFNVRHSLNLTEKDYELDYLHTIKAKDLLMSTKYKIAVRAYNGCDGKESSFETFSPPEIPSFKKTPTFKVSNNTIEIETSEIKNFKENDTYKLFLFIQRDEINASTHEKILKRLEMKFGIKTSHLRIVYKCRYKTRKNSTTENSNDECGQKFSAILSGSTQNVTLLLVHTDSNDQSSYKLYSFDADNPAAPIDSARNLSWLALLLLLLLIPAAIIIYKKRHTINEKIRLFKESMFGTTSLDMESPTEAVPLMTSSTKPEIKNSRIYSKKVPLKQFEEYVKQSLSDGELERQHALLPRGQTKPWECGALPENKSKNRYTNLMAYDQTRVVLANLKNQKHSDYINANYINGYKVPKAYIATQGPKIATTSDFWRMIWQENVQHIAMLANVLEAGKKKVEKYWPDKNATISFENISIHFSSSQVFADYEHRIFDVVCNNERRTVHQYHFFSWPDHGVPLYSQSLVPFLQNLQKITPDSKSPIVVHCSAGVGRTGTIILCDICLRMAAEEKEVDVLRIFQKLRDQRPNMVDNVQQYKLAHLVILEYLLGTKTGIVCSQLGTEVEKLITSGEIEKQISYLEDTAWQDQAMQSIVPKKNMLHIVKEKNRFQSIVPEIQSCIYLSRYPIDDETSTYINAVQVDGFQSPDRFIVTQQPMPNTLGDFWRLIHEKEVSVIISLNEINVKNGTCFHFWPSESKKELKPVDYITLNYVNTHSTEIYDLVDIRMYINDSKDYKMVEVVSLKNWPAKTNCPKKIQSFLSFWEETNILCRKSNSVVVTCFDGALASGLYLALSFVIEKMKLEQICDVCQAVRTIRHSRGHFIPNKEQFEFLYRAAVAYIDEFQFYANFN